MKKLLLAEVLFMGLFSASCVQRTRSEDMRQLLDLEKQWIGYEFKADTVAIASILDESFLCVSPDITFTKKNILKHIVANHQYRQTNNITIDSLKIENPIIHFYNNAAIVIFTDHTYAHKDQAHLNTRTQFYDVWISTNGTWKAVSSQAHY